MTYNVLMGTLNPTHSLTHRSATWLVTDKKAVIYVAHVYGVMIVSQVTSEMRGDEPIVRHLVPFEATFTRGTVIAVQFGAACQNGYVQPVPRLLNQTSELDLCIEHRTDAVKCFAELATEKVLDSYQSIEHYQVCILYHQCSRALLQVL